MRDAEVSKYGPEEFPVQYHYDDVGRLTKKIVGDYTGQEASRYEVDFTFDGHGQMTRERILKWDSGNERMTVMQDIHTSYDLAGKPKEIEFYDQTGKAYKETRTYVRGYQLTNATFSELGSGVTVPTSGSYTYDTNNNLTGTKKINAQRSGTQLAYREDWTFIYDRKLCSPAFPLPGNNKPPY